MVSEMVRWVMTGMRQWNIEPFWNSMNAVQKELRADTSTNPFTVGNSLTSHFNGLNPYHTFLETQKSRKHFFEAALVHIQQVQRMFPMFRDQMQQTENYIRTNLAFTFTFERPDWNLDYPHEVIASHDFVDIVKFPADAEKNNGRTMLLVAPMSGHFATLLRKTIDSLHKDGYTVCITDWKSQFDVPKEKWEFTVDRQTEEILLAYYSVAKDVWEFDVLAVCQPSPETMTATAYAEMNNLAKPRSITLLAGPIDVSQSPTSINKASEKLTPNVVKSLKLTIPKWHAWAGREIYAGFIQVLCFISTKPEEHKQNFKSLAHQTTPFTPEQEKMLDFYKEYFTVLDLPAEFHRETVDRVFRSNEWATGKVEFQGETVDFSTMTTPLVTVEWGRDDICGIGQTSAAHIIAPNTDRSLHIPVPDAGHYGSFAGKDFRKIVLPALDIFFKRLQGETNPWVSQDTSNNDFFAEEIV
jgi:poly(3-hydroxybutyrate) depolymerase